MTPRRRYFFPKHYADVVQRLRVPLGFVLVGAFAWLAAPTPGSLVAGLPVALVGVAARAWAAGHLKKNTELAMSGPYAYVRNPLYVGTLTTALGLAIAARQIGLAVLFGLAFLLVYLPAIELEEQHLRKLFPGFDAYAERVPMIVPRIPPIPSTERFQLSVYLRNREYEALGGFLAGAAYLAWRAGVFSW
jgi:protein-S-isoprenylcysteine O-methyltransferase Ste14